MHQDDPDDFVIKQKLEGILMSAARYLERNGYRQEAGVLAIANPQLEPYFDPDGINLFFFNLILHVAPDIYKTIDAEEVRGRIASQIEEILEAMSPGEMVRVYIRPDYGLEYEEEWREGLACYVLGQGVTNQGRGHSVNPAHLEHDNLFFRSKDEINFYKAALEVGLVMAPLPVIVQNGVDRKHRREPDFILFRDGKVVIVEIDSKFSHIETLAQTQERLQFLRNQGIEAIHIDSGKCRTLEDARNEVSRVVRAIEGIKPLTSR